MWFPLFCIGTIMIGIGIITVFVGICTSNKFASLCHSLTDESFEFLSFSNYDTDCDGYINPCEFSYLLSHVGMELDD